jgi:hypothetical protein
MRKILIVLPALLAASPAVAQEMPPQLPPELTDPATVHRLAGTVQALSQVFLDMRVGGMKAALEGREATPQERNMTVRDLARRKDPDFDRHLRQKVASVGPEIERQMIVMQRAIPEMMRDLGEAQKVLERAAANMPDPSYPRR